MSINTAILTYLLKNSGSHNENDTKSNCKKFLHFGAYHGEERLLQISKIQGKKEKTDHCYETGINKRLWELRSCRADQGRLPRGVAGRAQWEGS